MMLALETAAYGGSSVALLEDGALVEQTVFLEERKTAAQLLPAISALCDRHDARNAVDVIAVDCGPGSFTGIRIGISTAKGLADGWGAKTIGVSQFDLFPSLARPGTDQVVLIDARAGDGFYYELRRAGEAVKRGFVGRDEIPRVLPVESSGVVCGDIDEKLLDGTGWTYSPELPTVDACSVGKAAAACRDSRRRSPLEAIYLHTRLSRPR